ncbi:hypothetical protein GCM10010970_13020 [Silvimonas iriomotensis]|uniref:Uncharacterized protein n=1 Tax=Silvimonas iriomotensis TaxID=449662 RepID=A0ABQ2P7B0_9NEIS|nr:hypothetical protein GCM10010970_13020 [Silvimonas iriomotensis]
MPGNVMMNSFDSGLAICRNGATVLPRQRVPNRQVHLEPPASAEMSVKDGIAVRVYARALWGEDYSDAAALVLR